MSYVGKILVVVQVVLSLLFMAFAGAVFSMHQNWNDKYTAEKESTTRLQANLGEVQNQLELARSDFDIKFKQEESRATRFQAENDGLKAQVQRLTTDVEKKEAQREEQTGLAESKSLEANFRQAEAEKQRIENDKLRVALDVESSKVRDLQDQVFTRDVTLEELRKQYKGMLTKMAYLERVVAAHNLETDPDKVAKMKLPPPPVDGLVIAISKNRANRVEFVEISIGSDDGLIVGHELDVIRLNAKEKSSDWLGRVLIVDVQPDSAVGRVVVPAKNGIIANGDTATSKLGQPAVTQLKN